MRTKYPEHMPSGGRVNINRQQWSRVVERATEASAIRGRDSLTRRLSAEVIAAGRVDTGKMASEWGSEEVPAKTPNGHAWRVWSKVPYTPYQNYGTRGAVARPGHALRFRAGGQIIFRKSVKGITGAHFMERAVGSMRVSDWLP